MLEEQQQQRRDALDDDLLVPVHVDAQLHALQDGDAAVEGRTAPGCGSREAHGVWGSCSSTLQNQGSSLPPGLTFLPILNGGAKMH